MLLMLLQSAVSPAAQGAKRRRWAEIRYPSRYEAARGRQSEALTPAKADAVAVVAAKPRKAPVARAEPVRLTLADLAPIMARLESEELEARAVAALREQAEIGAAWAAMRAAEYAAQMDDEDAIVLIMGLM